MEWANGSAEAFGSFPDYNNGDVWAYGIVNLVIYTVGMGLVTLGHLIRTNRTHDARARTSHPPDRKRLMTSPPPHPPVQKQPALPITMFRNPQPVLDQLRTEHGPVVGLGSARRRWRSAQPSGANLVEIAMVSTDQC